MMKYWEIIADNLSKAVWSWRLGLNGSLRAASNAPASQTEPKRDRVSPLAKIAPGLVGLDYSAEVVQHADNCPARAREGAVFRVGNRVADRVWS